MQSKNHPKHRLGPWRSSARWLGALAFGLLLCGFERSTAAAEEPLTQCLTESVDLPNLPGVPNWFGPTSDTDPWRAELNDPRWSGAAPFSLCTNPILSACPVGLEQAEFRAFVDGTKLYVAIHVIADDVTNGNDAVFIGVGRATGNGAVAAMITPDTSATRIVPPDPGIASDPTPPIRNLRDGPFSTTKTWWATKAGPVSNWRTGLPPASPTWLQDVATWTHSPGVAWAITAVIELGQLGYSEPLTQEARLFVGTRFLVDTDDAVMLPTPADDTQTIGVTDETIIPTDKSLWTQFDTPAYCTDGVLLAGTFIGVWDGKKLGSKINTTPGATNDFRVKPRYVPESHCTTEFSIKSKVYLSTWGLLPVDRSQAHWVRVGCDGSSAGVCEPPPGTGWDWQDCSATMPTIEYTCQVSAEVPNRCPDISPANAEPKQAMLAELCPEGAVRYRQKAAYRTMTLTTLSALDDQATLVLPKGAKEVQLLVRTYNMPPPSTKRRRLPLEAMDAVLNYATQPPLRPRYQAVAPAGRGRVAALKAKPLPKVATQDVGAFAPLPAAQLATAALAERELNPLTVPTLTAESALRQVWPTYMVYGYVKSGQERVVKGKRRAVLEPMVPYGYYLRHDAPFYGFTHSLGASSTIDSVQFKPGPRPGVYVLSVSGKVDSITLNTKIATVDTLPPPTKPPPGPPPPGPPTANPNPTARSHCYCDVPGRMTSGAAGLGLVAVALALVLRVHRARRSARKPRA
ncbi:MAG: hypothetical protein JW940_12140 [Polyangiaceae bacterium]|nr:hypothetical protein [Polyangiaceae bacterium]